VDEYLNEVKNERDYFTAPLNYAKYVVKEKYLSKTANEYLQAVINYWNTSQTLSYLIRKRIGKN